MQTEMTDRTTALELLMDSVGSMTDVASMLSAICHEKANHIRGMWDDESRGGCWDRWAKQFDAASATLPNPYGV